MSTVFVGGSRHISHLPPFILDRLRKLIANNCQVVVGDANGVDKAVQSFFSEAGYKAVTVFCSGAKHRNNVGKWETHSVYPPRTAKGFQFYAAKDREMALAAEFGLMIWDGKSPGTVLNVLRLIRAEKIALLIDVPAGRTIKFKSTDDWNAFLATCDDTFRYDLKSRATPEEWETSSVIQSRFSAKSASDELDYHTPTMQ